LERSRGRAEVDLYPFEGFRLDPIEIDFAHRKRGSVEPDEWKARPISHADSDGTGAETLKGYAGNSLKELRQIPGILLVDLITGHERPR
jgi:hypothetical protein